MKSYLGPNSTGHARTQKLGLAAILLLCLVIVALLLFSSGNFGLYARPSIKQVPPSADALKLAESLKPVRTLISDSLQLCPRLESSQMLPGAGNTDALTAYDVPGGGSPGAITVTVSITPSFAIHCSPDSHWAAAQTLSNTVEVLDVNTRKITRQIKPLLPPEIPLSAGGVTEPYVYGRVDSYPLAWSSDSRELLTRTSAEVEIGTTVRGKGSGGVYTSIQRWDLNTGRMLAYINLGYDPGLEQYILSPDSNILAVSTHHWFGPDVSGMTVELWDTHTALRRGSLNIYSNWNHPLHWSPDSRTLAILLDRQIKLVDAATMKITGNLPEALPPPYTPTPDPNSPPIGTQSGIGGPQIPPPLGTVGTVNRIQPGPVSSVPPANYTPIVTPVAGLPPADPNNYQSISQVVWSHDGTTVATYDASHIRFWDARTGKLKAITRHPDTIYDVSCLIGWSADGRLFATLDREQETRVLRLWDGSTAAPLRDIASDVLDFQWSLVDLGLLVWRERGHTIEVWGEVWGTTESTESPPTATQTTISSGVYQVPTHFPHAGHIASFTRGKIR